MSRNTGNKSAAPRKSGNPLLTGILVGMVIGVGLAAGLAWYIMKSPSPFVQKEPAVAKTSPEAVKPTAPSSNAVVVPPPVAPASGVSDAKPRFEFYKVLTDKQDANVAAPAKPVDKAPGAENKPAVSEAQFLQAGAFANADDAEKLKAKLAFLGVQASIQVATLADKGVWHRVRLGPYKNAEELSRVQILLKQNGVEATPVRVQ